MFETVWILIGTMLSLISLGVVASFSPTLYALTAAVSQSGRSTELLRSKLSGIVLGILFLATLFQFFHPDTLVSLFNSTVTALVISTWFYILIGGLFIAHGIIRLQSSPVLPGEPKVPVRPKTGSRWATASIGFLKTTFKLSAVASVLIATRVIIETTSLASGRLLLFMVFIAGALVPFIGLFVLFRTYPRLIVKARARLTQVRKFLETSRFIAVIAVTVGAAIIIFSISESLRVG